MTAQQIGQAQEKFNALPPRAYKREQVCPTCGGEGTQDDGGLSLRQRPCRDCGGTGIVSVGPKRKEP